MTTIQEKLAEEYDVSEANGVTTFAVKSGDAQPYRVRQRTDGTWTLAEAYQPRTYAKQSWNTVARDADRDALLIAIAKRHNHRCTYMAHWRPIVL